jgi:hypothetical protein
MESDALSSERRVARGVVDMGELALAAGKVIDPGAKEPPLKAG